MAETRRAWVGTQEGCTGSRCWLLAGMGQFATSCVPDCQPQGSRIAAVGFRMLAIDWILARMAALCLVKRLSGLEESESALRCSVLTVFRSIVSPEVTETG